MLDLVKFERDFKTWAESAPLPALVSALATLAAEAVARGPRARAYLSRPFLDAAVLVCPSSTEE